MGTETINTSVDTGEEIQVVAFKLGDEEYAVDILSVQEIIKLLSITRVPGANRYLEGVINLRGTVIPVLNLHKRFGLGEQSRSDNTHIIVCQHHGVKAGMIVDEVSEVSRIKTSAIEAASTIYRSMNHDLIQGVGKMNGRLIIVLELQNLLKV